MSENKSMFSVVENEDNSESVLKNILNNVSNGGTIESNEETTTVKEKELSPLEKLQKSKEEGKVQSGMIVSNDDLNDGKEIDNKTIALYDESRMDDFKKYGDSLDDELEKRHYVTLIKSPVDQFEYMMMMEELSSVVIENGKAIFNLKDSDGNPRIPVYFRAREEGDPEFDLPGMKTVSETKSEEEDVVSESDDTSSDTMEGSNNETVTILIDKTGFGVDFAFTEEERKKIADSRIIRLKEVHTEELKTLISNKSERSFGELISPMDTSGVYTMMYFPASGFKAQMKGLTYGEYTDLALALNSMNFDAHRKRLTLIYNKMVDPSCKPFENFEDFLHRFSYTDIPLALYGILVSTELEESEIQLECNNDACRETFDWKFKTRSVLRLDQCAEHFQKEMAKLVTADPNKYDEYHENSSVMQSKYIEFPGSKYIIEFGIASAYHFLYNFIPMMNEDSFNEIFGKNMDDDLKEIYIMNSFLLTTVRKIYVPDKQNGGYIECSSTKDILDAIYSMPAIEINMVTSYQRQYQEMYNLVFSLGDVECPHCHHVSENSTIDIDNLVFRTFQRLMSTEFDLNDMLVN